MVFLQDREWSHVAFTSRLLDQGKPRFPESVGTRVYVNRSDEQGRGIQEALLISRGGLIVPALRGPLESPAPREDLKTLLSGRSRTVFSITGSRSGVECIQEALERMPTASVDYDMLVRDLDTLPPEDLRKPNETEFGDLVIRRAGPGDAGRLFPLQRDYEIEEVLLDPSRFDEGLSYRHLQQTLSRQTVFYAQLKRRVVAKAGTNALGIGFAQVGGVFTVKDLRSKGIAFQLMKALIAEMSRVGKHLCLFVKKSNQPASTLYGKLGFDYRNDFRITYFR